MYKKLKKIFLVMSILGILFTNSYTNEIKEVQLIDDFSAELLGETPNSRSEVQKSPVKQDAEKVTEDKNIAEKQTGKKEDEIVKVLQKGYMMKGKVIRPAMVIVCKK